MTKMLEVVDERYEGELTLDNVYSLALVTNTLEHDASVVRGIATENIVTKEVNSSFFSDIDSKIKEYENLADHQIDTTLAPSTALRQFVHKWPQHVVLVGTNVNMWLIPMVRELEAEFEWLKGRDCEILDLGRVATVTAETHLFRSDKLTGIFPVSRFNSKTGSLSKLAEKVGVTRAMFLNEPIYARARAMMIAESFRRYMDKQLE